jgi:hypothetical protein
MSKKTVPAALCYGLRSLAFCAQTAHGYFPRAGYGNVGRVETSWGEDIMRKLLAAGGAAALALWALAASADEYKGAISNIDLTRNTFQLEGKTYTASPTNTVGVKLSELKEGDTVTIHTATVGAATKEPINVMSMKKVD